MATGITIGIMIDGFIEKTTGKTVWEHTEEAIESALKPDQCEVAPTGDG